MSDQKKYFGPNLEKSPGMSLVSYCDHVWGVAYDEIKDADPNKMDEQQLARIIRFCVSEFSSEDAHDLLLEIANALDHPKAETKLKLVRAKAGRPRTYAQYSLARGQQSWVAQTVWHGYRKFGKMEAAVAYAMEHSDLSRASVFRMLKSEAKFRTAVKSLADFRKKTVSGEADSSKFDAEYQEFLEWLDRFARDTEPRKI